MPGTPGAGRSTSGTKPRRPKSTWHSVPAGGSSTRTVLRARRPAPQRSTPNWARVRCGTTMPLRVSRMPILSTVSPSVTQSLISNCALDGMSGDPAQRA